MRGDRQRPRGGSASRSFPTYRAHAFDGREAAFGPA